MASTAKKSADRPAKGPAKGPRKRSAGSPAERPARSRGKAKPPEPPGRRWSHHVMETSDALDLEAGVFTKDSAAAIARSLKRSAEDSTRRKTDAFRSAMSMLDFYINRGGKNLSAERKKILEAAKQELRALYGK
jgi:hypothetical protein